MRIAPLTYRATMRQGLMLLALLGAAIGVEVILPADWPRWVFTGVVMVERGLFALLLVVLAMSLIQRAVMVAQAAHAGERPRRELARLLVKTPHGAFFVLHGGLVVLIAAFGYAKSGSVEAVMELPIGAESREARLDDGRRLTLPFTVRATAFNTEHYETGEVKQFVGGVELTEGDMVVRSSAVGVGAPLDYRGYRFSLFRFGFVGTRVEGRIRSIADPMQSVTYTGEVGGTIEAPTSGAISLLTIEEHATRRTPDGDRDVGRAIVYQVTGRDGRVYEVMSYESASHVVDYRPVGGREFESVHVLADRDAALALPFSEYLTVSSIDPRKAIGLQIRYYPGLMVLLASGTLVVLGVAWMLAFWKPPTTGAPMRARPPIKALDLTGNREQTTRPAASAPVVVREREGAAVGLL
ncbi:MAG: cytochrome c biogenesis protein ResB [Nitrospirota bacterium]